MADVAELKTQVQSLQKDVDSKAVTIKHLQNAIDAKTMTIGILQKTSKEGGNLEEHIGNAIKSKLEKATAEADQRAAKLEEDLKLVTAEKEKLEAQTASGGSADNQSQISHEDMAKKISETRAAAEEERKQLQAKFEKNIDERNALISSVTTVRDSLQTKVEEMEGTIASLSNERDELKQAVEEHERNAELAEAELEGVRIGEENAEQRAASLEEELKRVKADKEQFEADAKKLTEELTANETERQNISADVVKAEQRATRLEEELRNVTAGKEEVEREVNKLKEEIAVKAREEPLELLPDDQIQWMWGDATLIGHGVSELNPMRWSSAKSASDTILELGKETGKNLERRVQIVVKRAGKKFKEVTFSNINEAIAALSPQANEKAADEFSAEQRATRLEEELRHVTADKEEFEREVKKLKEEITANEKERKVACADEFSADQRATKLEADLKRVTAEKEKFENEAKSLKEERRANEKKRLDLQKNVDELTAKTMSEVKGDEAEYEKKWKSVSVSLKDQSQFSFEEMTKKISEIREITEDEKKRLQAQFEQKIAERSVTIVEVTNSRDTLQTQVESMERTMGLLTSERDDLLQQVHEHENNAELSEAELEGVREGQKRSDHNWGACMLALILRKGVVAPAFSLLRQSLPAAGVAVTTPSNGASNGIGKLPPLSGIEEDKILEEPGKDESDVDSTVASDGHNFIEEEEEDEDDEDEEKYGLDDEGQEEWAEMLRANTLNALFTSAGVVVTNAGAAADDLCAQVCNITCSLDMFPQMYARQLQELDRTGKGKELRDFVYILRKALDKCQRISGAISELCCRNEDVFGNLQNLVRVKGLEWQLKSLRSAGQSELLIKLLRNSVVKLKDSYDEVLDQYGDQCEKNGTLEDNVEMLQKQLSDAEKQVKDADSRVKDVETQLAAANAAVAAAASQSRTSNASQPPRKSTTSVVLGQDLPQTMDSVHQMLGQIEKSTLEAAGKGAAPEAAPAKGKGKGKGKKGSPPPPPGAAPAGDPPPAATAAPAPAEAPAPKAAEEAAPKGKGKKGKPPPPPGAAQPAPEPAPAPVVEAAPAAAAEGKGKGKGKGKPPPAPGKGQPPAEAPAAAAAPAAAEAPPAGEGGKGKKGKAGPPDKGGGKPGGPPVPGGKPAAGAAGGGKGKGKAQEEKADPGPPPPPDMQAKKFHWASTGIKGNVFENSIFKKIADKVATEKLAEESGGATSSATRRRRKFGVDFDMLTSFFFTAKKQEPSAEELAKQAAASQKKKVATCLDQKTSQGVEIFLNGCGVDIDMVRRLVVKLDDSALQIENLEKVINLYPDAELLPSLQTFAKENDPKEVPWARADTFLLDMIGIKDFKKRAECCMTRGTFAEQFRNVEDDIKMVRNCLFGVCNSKGLVAVFGLVVQTGNFLNFGTSKGAQRGFTLDSLPMLMRVDGFNDKTYTLMRFLMDTLEGDKALRDEALKDMEFCDPSSKIDFSEALLNLDRLSKAVGAVDVLVKPADESNAGSNGQLEDPIFEGPMRKFATEAKEKLEVLSVVASEASELSEQCKSLFCEKKSTKVEEILKKLADFKKDMEEARRQNLLAKAKKDRAEKKRMERENAEKAKAEKAEAKAKAKAEKEKKSSGGDDKPTRQVSAGDDKPEKKKSDHMMTISVKDPAQPKLAHSVAHSGASTDRTKPDQSPKHGPAHHNLLGANHIDAANRPQTLGPGAMKNLLAQMDVPTRMTLGPGALRPEILKAAQAGNAGMAGRMSVGMVGRMSVGNTGRQSVGVPRSTAEQPLSREELKKLFNLPPSHKQS